ncbi:glycosyltransferase [Agrobacterium tumefaciens]|uniref:glycosyltransferase n=1 Tax=Agrobacterium tumefaciens TaxID=358 RepID=UPI001571F098|nr:glycosyltransferase [Agrobacterium tumefaciens]NSY51284.1 glycosyltransferase [Agrobacterium tumefaciens]NTD89013.1 glycosyltransferase [Agrobacterium tumefaciens]NTD93469.1 glycosyltransferase [Agrobacterium tumefaciens]NTD97434.1 glycosyltransferase [Agrobacterium tumefaciens]NTE16699.1 glycosyltransferase [Agrobacterium tumefaciens]
MTLRIRSSRDLISINLIDPNRWESTGDDPFFDIRFNTLRKPILVAFIRTTDGEMIEPKVYLNRGHGYRERDTVQHEPGHSFIVTADVGRLGLVKSLRIDPSAQPGEFSFQIEAFPNWDSAEHVINLRMEADMQSAKRWDIGRLPRFRLKLPSPRLRHAKSQVLEFIDTQYGLAQKLHVVRPEPNDNVWLSIVVPVYNAPKRYLDDLVKSFETQHTEGVELILSDDASTSEETLRFYEVLAKRNTIKIARSGVNRGIANATNEGLALASGTWVTLLDHDDLIAPHALKMIAATIVANPQCQFLYTDEVVVNDRLVPDGLMLKPAFDPVLLTGVNYINHFSVYRHDRLRRIGYLRTAFDGSQDYDLLLRYLEGIPEQHVIHIPYPAYWWRRTGQTYSRRFMDKATEAARLALSERFQREGQVIKVVPALTETLHRVEFSLPKGLDWPKISIIIPSRDSFDLISTVLKGLFEETDYQNLEVIVIDNGTTDRRVLELYRSYTESKKNFSVTIAEEAFNFARAINRGMEKSSGEHFLILNNDIEVIDAGWLKEMVSCLKFDATGIVGAKLLYPNKKIQHAGVIVGFGGLAGHWYLNKPANFGGPMNRLHLRNSVTCVTGAAMLISGDCKEIVGSWDEENFAVAYNDVDYCIRAHKAGFRIVWTPFACMYHHESASRGSDLVGDKKRRFEQEKENLRLLHGTDTFDDPSINPGYEKRHSTPGLELPVHLAPARAGLRIQPTRDRNQISSATARDRPTESDG